MFAVVLQRARCLVPSQSPHAQSWHRRHPEMIGPPPPKRRKLQPVDGEETIATGTWTVRLRGLPYLTTVPRVRAFFNEHGVEGRIGEGDQAVQLLYLTNGRATGYALVRLRCQADVETVTGALQGKFIGRRYIDVFPHDSETVWKPHWGRPIGAAADSGTGGGATTSRPGQSQNEQAASKGDIQLLTLGLKTLAPGTLLSTEDLNAALSARGYEVDMLVDARCFRDPHKGQFRSHVGYHPRIVERLK